MKIIVNVEAIATTEIIEMSSCLECELYVASFEMIAHVATHNQEIK